MDIMIIEPYKDKIMKRVMSPNEVFKDMTDARAEKLISMGLAKEVIIMEKEELDNKFAKEIAKYQEAMKEREEKIKEREDKLQEKEEKAKQKAAEKENRRARRGAEEAKTEDSQQEETEDPTEPEEAAE